MSRNSELDTQVDGEIDAVARVLTSSPPPARLPAIIRMRLAAGSRARRARLWLSAAAAVALVGLVILVNRPPSDVVPNTAALRNAAGRLASSRGSTPVDPPAPAPQIVTLEPSGSSERRQPASLVERNEVVPISNPLVIESLDPLLPMSVDAIEVPALTVEAVSVEPVSQQ